MAATAATRHSGASSARWGGLSTAKFLRLHWHKAALVARGAFPGFAGPFSARALYTLAARDDVESRLVLRDGVRWTLAHGPFRRADFAALPARDWTLLVQGVNLVHPAGEALLNLFSFLPYARLDDLMVSYAAPGGGVGPHEDSYDVFLLQGFGRRRWRFGPQADHALLPGRPLKILRRFTPAHDEVLAPGDMLYLPPDVAHDGVAIDACTTYSIGFRAPGTTELATAFLDFLRDELDLPGRYADPDLAPVHAPAEIGAAMQRRCLRMLEKIAWDRATATRFLGVFLTEPKPHVFLEPPRTPMSRGAFSRRIAKLGVHVDRRVRLLYDRRHVYINGFAVRWPEAGAGMLRRLANGRALAPRDAKGLSPEAATILYNWYRDGYVHSDTASKR